jgi:hypothetical protein
LIGSTWSHPEFPNLVNGIKSSEADEKYNCASFAAGNTTKFWDPFMGAFGGDYYWPPKARKGRGVECFIEAFQTIGYELCSDGELDPSCEKIVFYLDDNRIVHHVARQLADGRWTSKLGQNVDIVHTTPECLVSDSYGKPRCYMHRPIEIRGTIAWT